MAITLVTPMDKLRQAINAAGANANLLTSAQYTDIVIGHALAASQTYTLQQVATGYYTFVGALGGSSWLHGGSPQHQGGIAFCLFAVGTPYTESGGVSSTFNCGWEEIQPNVQVTAGTQSGTTLTVTATPVNWAGVLVSTIRMLKGWAAREPDSVGFASGSTGYAGLMERLDTWESQTLGAWSC